MESSSSARGLVKAFLIVVLTIMVVMTWDARKVDAVTAAECKKERNLLVDACNAVVGGSPASDYCCQRVRVTHIECVCSRITPALALLIDVKRAVRVIQGCGRQVPRRYKCGSITTP